MGLDLKAPENVILRPIITVFGVGGAGGNAINNMIRSNLQGANFVVGNTDAQALKFSECNNRIQLGAFSTKGLGAGASPEVGTKAAEESEAEIRSYLEGSNMVFITSGMGGGTGTGASPVIARIASELGILTVGVVTKPFLFEGARRMKAAEAGLAELQKHVDTLIVIPNQNLFRIANENTTFTEAFQMADEVLHAGVRGVTDLITLPGLINLDFADIKTVMSEMGKAMMGTGEATGEDRAVKAAEAAIANPLLDHSSMSGARGVLINITGGKDMTLYEVDTAANRIREEVGDTDANIIFGSTFNPDLEGIIRVSVVATGIGAEERAVVNNEVKPQVKIEVAEAPSFQPIMQQSYPVSNSSFEDSLSANMASDQSAPSFNEYGNNANQPSTEEELQHKLAELTKQMSFQANLETSGPLHSERIEERQQEVKPAPSLFKRMWSSIMTTEASDMDKVSEDDRKLPSPPPISSGVSDVQDIPAFLRKGK